MSTFEDFMIDKAVKDSAADQKRSERMRSLEVVLRQIVHEYDQTYDGEIHSDGTWSSAASIPVAVMERAKALLKYANRGARSTQVVSENKFCEHGNRIGDFCSGCEQQRMG